VPQAFYTTPLKFSETPILFILLRKISENEAPGKFNFAAFAAGRKKDLMVMSFMAGHFAPGFFIFDIIHSAFRAFPGSIATAARAIHWADIGRGIFGAGLLLCRGFLLGTCALGSPVFAATGGNHQRKAEY
jgi:hypothetical protein